jgi:hypothetical protein
MRGKCCDERETWGFEDVMTLPSQHIFETSFSCVSMDLSSSRRPRKTKERMKPAEYILATHISGFIINNISMGVLTAY